MLLKFENWTEFYFLDSTKSFHFDKKIDGGFDPFVLNGTGSEQARIRHLLGSPLCIGAVKKTKVPRRNIVEMSEAVAHPLQLDEQALRIIAGD